MSPFLGVKYEFLAAGLTFVLGYPTMTEPVGVIISSVGVLVGAVNTFVDHASMTFGVPSEIALIEKTLTTLWIHTEEAWLRAVRVHVSFHLALECECPIAFGAL